MKFFEVKPSVRSGSERLNLVRMGLKGSGDLSGKTMDQMLRKNIAKIFKKLAGDENCSEEGVVRQESQVRPPIGLIGCSRCSWISSFFQFLVFIPSFLDMVPFMDHGFKDVWFWFSKYQFDQDLKKDISGVDLEAFYYSMKKLDVCLFKDSKSSVNFQKVFDLIFDRAFLSLSGGNVWDDYMSINPEWMIDLGNGKYIQHWLVNVFSYAPSDFILFCSKDAGWKVFQGKRQIFVEGKSFFYEVESFIERVIHSEEDKFISYVKVGLKWFQCNDEIIREVSSRFLKRALERAVLLRYRKVFVL